MVIKTMSKVPPRMYRYLLSVQHAMEVFNNPNRDSQTILSIAILQMSQFSKFSTDISLLLYIGKN